MTRFRTLEEMTAKGRADLAAAAPVWLAPARDLFEGLTRMCVDPSVTDADFEYAVALAAEQMPDLWERLDKVTLAQVFEGYMGQAMVNGIEDASVKVQDSRKEKP